MQHLVARQLVAAAGGQDWIEDERHIRIVGQNLGDRGDILDAAEHADLEHVDRHVFEETACLIGDPLRIERLDALDA